MRYKSKLQEYVSFSDKKCIIKLIKNRHILDECYNDLMFYNGTGDISASGIYGVDEYVICIYTDLERLIKKANLNQQQLKIVHMYFEGHNTRDICDLLDCQPSSVDRIMDTIAGKIAEQNHIEYIDYLHYSGKVRVDNNARYKKCSKCGEYKDVMKGEFSVKKDSKDGYHPYCKECRTNM